jgi:hypothetical protein
MLLKRQNISVLQGHLWFSYFNIYVYIGTAKFPSLWHTLWGWSCKTEKCRGYNQHIEINGSSFDFQASVLKSACRVKMVCHHKVSSHWCATTRYKVCRKFLHILHTHMILLGKGNVLSYFIKVCLCRRVSLITVGVPRERRLRNTVLSSHPIWTDCSADE